MELEVSKICRACLKEGTMMSIFKVQLFKKMMACASVQVWQNDGLPSQICNKCSAKLHISYQFKKQCEKSDAKLRQLVKIPEDGNDSSVEYNKQAPTAGPCSVETETRSQSVELQQNQIQVHHTAESLQNGCVFIECSPLLGIQQHEQEYQQNPLEEMEYNMQSNAANVINGYNIQTVYNGAYTVPLQQIQTGDHTIIQNNQIIVPPMQMQQSQTHMVPQHVVHQSDSHINIRNNNVNDDNDDDDEQTLGNNKQNSEESPNRASKMKGCTICKKVFATTTKLNRHMKIHNKIFPYKCTVCNKSFSHSGNYRIHLRMHSDERPYKCTVCNRGCRQAQDLEKHMRTHTGERPHKCPTCPKAFSSSSNLTAHIRTHTGEKPYVCCVCEKGFCQSNELTKHMRNHTGEKSHFCEICNKGFNGSSTLSIHRRIHTGEKPYVCKICSKGFTQSSCLKVHLFSHQRRVIDTDKPKRKKTIVSLTITSEMNEVLEQSANEVKPDMSFQCVHCPEKYVTSNALQRHARKHAQSVAHKSEEAS